MEEYIGLDVSMKDTAVSIRREGKRVWRGKCASDPQAIAKLLQKHAPSAARVVFETGPLSVWFYHALRAEGLPAICIDARHAKSALDMAPNKTDANDADGLAHLAEVGFYREVRVKGFESMLTRTLVAARDRLVRITTELSNQIRGLMKTFGIIVPAGKGGSFDAHVQGLLETAESGLAAIVWPLLQAWRGTRLQAAKLGRQLVADARESDACRLLMSIPGVGTVTATAFVTAIEDPENFRRSRSVGAWLGLTTRRYQSGQVDYDGHISRRGDRHLRSLLYEAAAVMLSRSSAESALRTWGFSSRSASASNAPPSRSHANSPSPCTRCCDPANCSTGPAAPRSELVAGGAQSRPREDVPAGDVGRAIPRDGVHLLSQQSASSTFEGSPAKPIVRRLMPTA